MEMCSNKDHHMTNIVPNWLDQGVMICYKKDMETYNWSFCTTGWIWPMYSLYSFSLDTSNTTSS